MFILTCYIEGAVLNFVYCNLVNMENRFQQHHYESQQVQLLYMFYLSTVLVPDLINSSNVFPVKYKIKLKSFIKDILPIKSHRFICMKCHLFILERKLAVKSTHVDSEMALTLYVTISYRANDGGMTCQRLFTNR